MSDNDDYDDNNNDNNNHGFDMSITSAIIH